MRSAAAIRPLQVRVSPLAPDEVILDLGRSEFFRLFRRVVAALGLQNRKVALYSLRRGGATHDFLSRGGLEKPFLRGRWTSTKSARIDVQDAVAALADCQLTATQIAHARAPPAPAEEIRSE